MRTKRVIITGAGFSAPAKLPVQNQIIQKMIAQNTDNFLANSEAKESLRFVKAYINAGQFLLDNYGKGDYEWAREELQDIEEALIRSNVLEKLLNDFTQKRIEVGIGALELINRKILNNDVYYTALSITREKIREALVQEEIDVNLEDIFTSFDKSTQSREYIKRYTYQQMDEIRYSIMCLFIYYLSKCTLEHDYSKKDYLTFIHYLKTHRTREPITIITTNWDTLLERYLDLAGISYSFPIQNEDILRGTTEKAPLHSNLQLIKLHGSIDWLKCLGCGSTQICTAETAAEFLFKDKEEQKCNQCHRSTEDYAMLLQPEIITPTMIKTISSKLYRELWDAAGSSLRAATHLIFIGYSLPIADYEFRYLLQKNVSAKAKIDVILYHDDNPNQTTSSALKSLLPEKRYKDLFPRNDVRFTYEGFGDFFEN